MAPRRRIVTVLAVCLAVPLAALPAAAADFADRAILGFSPDGGTFAFEEYGVYDGSGFPYSDIYVIDTTADSWVAGTPVRIVTRVESAPLAATRAEALKAAAPILDKRRVGEAGTLLVSNPITEMSADDNSVRFVVNPYLATPERTWVLTLTSLAVAETAPCQNFGPLAGFRLVLTGLASPRRIVLHDDAGRPLPASRGCPQGYAISDVVYYDPRSAAPALVVLLSVFSQGFEGADRRFLAVAIRPDPSLD